MKKSNLSEELRKECEEDFKRYMATLEAKSELVTMIEQRNETVDLAIIDYAAIKHPFAFFVNRHGSTIVWFEAAPDKVVAWDDIPENHPRWTLVVMTPEEAVKRARELVQETDWKLVETYVDELEELIEK